jgi:hypothetical protein
VPLFWEHGAFGCIERELPSMEIRQPLARKLHRRAILMGAGWCQTPRKPWFCCRSRRNMLDLIFSLVVFLYLGPMDSFIYACCWPP